MLLLSLANPPSLSPLQSATALAMPILLVSGLLILVV